jgi:hypothetical protein
MTLSFQLRRPIRFDAFTIEEPLTHILVNEVARRKPRVIVELGSGLSTVLIAKVIETVGFSCDFISIEEDVRYLKRTRAWLRAEGLDHFVALHQVPVIYEDKEEEDDLRGIWWYDQKIVDRLVPLDRGVNFLLVDGPCAKEGFEYIRWWSLENFYPHLLACAPDSAALVDDTQRDRKVLERWKSDLQPAAVRWTDFGTGRGASLLEFL